MVLEGEQSFASVAPVRTDRTDIVRRAEKTAAACLQRDGALLAPIASFLLFVVILVTVYALYSAVFVFLDPSRITALVDWSILVLFVLLALVVAMPLYFGRMCLFGRMLTGRRVFARDALRYYCSPVLMRRTLPLALIHLLVLFAPFGVAIGGCYASYVLLITSVGTWFSASLSLVLFLVGCLVAILLGVLLHLLSGVFFFTAALAVGNESLPLCAAIRKSARLAKGNLRRIAGFRVRNAVFLLLSLFTVGILYVLYYAHRIPLAYLQLCMDLKGEKQ